MVVMPRRWRGGRAAFDAALVSYAVHPPQEIACLFGGKTPGYGACRVWVEISRVKRDGESTFLIDGKVDFVELSALKWKIDEGRTELAILGPQGQILSTSAA